MSSFVQEEDKYGFAWTSNFLSAFCPEPDYTLVPVSFTYPDPRAASADNAAQLIEALVNQAVFKDDSWYDWRLQNWGTKWELYDICLDDDTDSGDVSFSFSTAWSPPLEGVYAISKKFPNALFVLSYEESGSDFCGVSFVLNGRVFDQEFKISDLKNLWLKEFHPDLYERTQAEDSDEDEDLQDELMDFWCDHDYKAIEWVLCPVAEILRDLILFPAPATSPRQLTVGSNVIDINVEEWIPTAPPSLTLEEAQRIAAERFSCVTKELIAVS